MHILSFLVNFGANLFALDNDFHTAMDVAASRDRMDCVRFLDAAAAKQTNQNPKKVALMKKEAVKEAEKRVKLCEKVKKRHQSTMDKKVHNRPGSTGTVTEVSLGSALSNIGSVSRANEQYSKLIAVEKSGSLSSRVKGTLQRKLGKKDKGSVGKSDVDGNVIFLKQDSLVSRRPEFMEVFSEQDEELLENDEIEKEDNENGESGEGQQSLFNRPGLGGLIFMNTMGMDSDDVSSRNNENLSYLFQKEMSEADDNAAGFEEDGDAELWQHDDLGLDDGEDTETSPLDVFLSSISLPEFALAFSREHLDLEALMLCSDEDLKGIRIQLGPRKKILDAASRRKSALKNPGIIKDSSLWFNHNLYLSVKIFYIYNKVPISDCCNYIKKYQQLYPSCAVSK